MTTKPQTILVTSGEPSGIGPDICLDIPSYTSNLDYPLVVIGDIDVLRQRAKILKRSIKFEQVDESNLTGLTPSSAIRVLNVTCPCNVIPGTPNPANAVYVINILNTAIKLCQNSLSNIIVTAPVNKKIINDGGIKFIGHTEYFAEKFNVSKVVMMLANKTMKVALLTVHLPLKEVAQNVTPENLNATLNIIINYFKHQLAIPNPQIAVCGLNPHAGEGGYLGIEELNIINPVIETWRARGYAISGSYPADSIFLHADKYDVILAMYHDQGLPVLKYSGFESGINITLGLPIIRTSVDHGTALNIAGTGLANSQSLIHAIQFATGVIK